MGKKHNVNEKKKRRKRWIERKKESVKKLKKGK
jgi:hypothetical protein